MVEEDRYGPPAHLNYVPTPMQVGGWVGEGGGGDRESTGIGKFSAPPAC